MENINSAEQMGALSPQAVRNMSADQLGGIAPEVIAGMTAEQMSEMPPEAMAGMSAPMMEAMPPETMAGMSAPMINYLQPEAMAGFSAPMWEPLPPRAMAGFTSLMWEPLPPEAMDSMSAPVKYMMDKLVAWELENGAHRYEEILSNLPTDTTKDALLAPDILEQALTAADPEGLPNTSGIIEGDGIWDNSATAENNFLEGVTPMGKNVTSVDIETDVDSMVSGIMAAENQNLDPNFDSALASMDKVTAKNIAKSIDATQTDTADTPKSICLK